MESMSVYVFFVENKNQYLLVEKSALSGAMMLPLLVLKNLFLADSLNRFDTGFDVEL